MKTRFTALLAACAALLPAAPAAAGLFPAGAFDDAARGTTAAQFLKVPPSARFAALGGAGLALESSPDSFFLNPAGLAAQERGRGAASLSYEALPGGVPRSGLAWSGSYGQGVLSAGLIYTNSGAGLEALDGAGRSAGGEIAAYDAAAGAGWSFASGLSRYGFVLKGVRSRLDDESGQTAALDAGAIFKAGPGGTTDLAVAVRNFGPPLKVGSRAAPLPFEAAAGLNWAYSPQFDILLEGRLPVDHSSYIVFGGELFLPFVRQSRRVDKTRGLYARAALNFKNYDDLGFLGAFAAGFGVRHSGLSLDYAFCPYGDLGSAHRVTAGLRWGGAAAPAGPGKKKVAAAVERQRESLVVGPFSYEGAATETQAEVLRGFVESELVKTGKFRLVERTNTEFLLKEKKLAASGLAGERLASELGVFTGADSAVFGAVFKDRGGFLVTVRQVDTATGEILRSESAPAKEEYLLREAARRLAAALSAD